MTSKWNRFVHEHNGRWIVANYVESANQYHAPMTPEGSEATGCHTAISRDIKALAHSPNIYSYRCRPSALRLAKQLWPFPQHYQH